MTYPDNAKKRGNSAFLVFDHICLHPGETRSDVSLKVGLSVTAVGSAVDSLIDEGLLSAFPGPSKGGRPAELLYPSYDTVLLADVRRDGAGVFITDLTGSVAFSEQRFTDSSSDPNDVVRYLIGSAADSPQLNSDGLFAVAFLSDAGSPIDPDVFQYARSRLSPLFMRKYDADLLSVEVTLSKNSFDGDVLFCSVSPEGVNSSCVKRMNGKTVFGDSIELISSHGTGFGRVFRACRDAKEAGEELADALLNSVAIMSPDAVLLEISGIGFDEKLGGHVKGVFEKKLTNAPAVKTFFRDENGLRSALLSRLRRSPFERRKVQK